MSASPSVLMTDGRRGSVAASISERVRLSRVPVFSIPPGQHQPRLKRLSARLVTRVPAILLLPLDTAAFGVAVQLTGTTNVKTFVVLVLVLAFFHNADLYRSRLSLSILDDAPALIGRSLAAGAGAMVLGGLDDGTAGTRRLGTAAVFGVLCFIVRGFAYGAIRLARRRRHLRQRTLILGSGTVAGLLAGNLLDHPEYGLSPEGL